MSLQELPSPVPAFEPMLGDTGRPLKLDKLLAKAAPWVRTLAIVLAKDEAATAVMVRSAFETDAGAEALGNLLDRWPALAEALEELAGLLRDGHARLSFAGWKLLDTTEAA